MREIPKTLSDGYKIELEDDKIIEKICKDAEQDKALKNDSQKCAL
jgi:hypothetical protein